VAIRSVKSSSLAWLLILDLEIAPISSKKCGEADLIIVKVLGAGRWYSQAHFAASPGWNRKGAERAAEFRSSLNSDTCSHAILLSS